MLPSDKEQELIEQLASEKHSLRLQAIVKLSRIGNSKAALKALSSHASNGNREESFFAAQAIEKISQKLGIEFDISQIEQPVLSENKEKAHNREYTPKDFLTVSKDQAYILLKYVRENRDKLSEDILPSVGVFLGKYGDRSDTEFIQNHLMKHSDNFTLPYIAAAEKIDISMLIPALPHLLASNEALVRSRSVISLRRIDPIEAERHFLNLLSSKQAENRLAAIEISFLFPFERVKDYIIALLGEEKDPDVFKACATVLASNPSLEIALRILDIVESMPPEQRKRGTAVFNIVSAAIISAKILPEKEATPQALLAKWKQQRLQHFLDDLEIQLCASTGQKRETIVSWIEKNRSIPKVANFIEKLALNPQTEDIYMRLSGSKPLNTMILPPIESLIKETDRVAKTQTSFATKKVEEKESEKEKAKYDLTRETKPRENQNSLGSASILPDLTETETEVEANEKPSLTKEQEQKQAELKKQIKYLKEIDLSQFLTEKNKIFELVENPQTELDIKVEALNALLRLASGPKLKSYGLSALEKSDTKLKVAGFKILEKVAPDVLKERLPELFVSTDINLRARAIRFGLKIDQVKSIEALKKMVVAKDQNSRSNAIGCLALCPFEMVYDILIITLTKETHSIIAKQITDILVSNPDRTILEMLDKMVVVNKNPTLELILSKARNDIEELLSAMPSQNRNNSIKEIDVFAKEVSTENKPYSVENVRKLNKSSSKQGDNKKEKPEDIKGVYKIIKVAFENPIVSLIVILVAIIIAGTILGLSIPEQETSGKTDSKDYRTEERKGSSPGEIPTGIRMNRTCTVKGQVINVISNASIVISYNNTEIMIKFKNSEGKNFKRGDNVTVTCVPYVKKPNIILANCKKISKIENNNKD